MSRASVLMQPTLRAFAGHARCRPGRPRWCRLAAIGDDRVAALVAREVRILRRHVSSHHGVRSSPLPPKRMLWSIAGRDRDLSAGEDRPGEGTSFARVELFHLSLISSSSQMAFEPHSYSNCSPWSDTQVVGPMAGRRHIAIRHRTAGSGATWRARATGCSRSRWPIRPAHTKPAGRMGTNRSAVAHSDGFSLRATEHHAQIAYRILLPIRFGVDWAQSWSWRQLWSITAELGTGRPPSGRLNPPFSGLVGHRHGYRPVFHSCLGIRPAAAPAPGRRQGLPQRVAAT